MSSRKLVVIGLDGADLRLIKKWRNELPAFDRILRKGSYGKLKSVIPPVTIPAWPSMFTGKKPESLGVPDFLFVDKQNRSFSQPDYQDMSRYVVWNLINEKSFVWNVPGTSPVPNTNTDFIGSWIPATRKGKAFVNPSGLKDRLKGEKLGIEKMLAVHNTVKEMDKDFEYLLDIESKQVKLINNLIDKGKYHLFVSVLRATDSVMHKKRGENPVKKVYKEIDSLVGSIQSNIGDANLLLVSDHGGARMYRKFCINTWLKEKGYLKMKGQRSKPGAAKTKFNYLATRVGLILSSLGFRKQVIKTKKKLFGKKTVSTVLTSMDWERTSAFAFLSKGNYYYPIYLLDKEVKEQLKEDLSNLVDPKTDKKIVKRIFSREEVYGKENIEGFPDLMVMLEDGYHTSAELMPVTFYDSDSFDHHRDGTIIGTGPDFEEDKEIEGANIFDVAPTIMHMLGHPVSKEMDGRVLKELFSKDSGLYRQPIEKKEYRLNDVKPKEEKEDTEEVKKRLKYLGYLD